MIVVLTKSRKLYDSVKNTYEFKYEFLIVETPSHLKKTNKFSVIFSEVLGKQKFNKKILFSFLKHKNI